MLRQSIKKAKIRVREGRAKAIDHLAVALGVLEPDADLLEEDDARPDFEIREPKSVIESLNEKQLGELKDDVEKWRALESRKTEKAFWRVSA